MNAALSLRWKQPLKSENPAFHLGSNTSAGGIKSARAARPAQPKENPLGVDGGREHPFLNSPSVRPLPNPVEPRRDLPRIRVQAFC